MPWLDGSDGYEDWCLLQGSWALDPLNASAVASEVGPAHDKAAVEMEVGHGGLYSLVWGEATLPDQSTAVWLTRPRGIQWRPILEALREQMPDAALWRRHMVLGPGKEFLLVLSAETEFPVPLGWSAVAINRARVQL